MTGKHGTPDRHPDRDRTNSASRDFQNSGIPPFRVAPLPQQPERYISEQRISEQHISEQHISERHIEVEDSSQRAYSKQGYPADCHPPHTQSVHSQPSHSPKAHHTRAVHASPASSSVASPSIAAPVQEPPASSKPPTPHFAKLPLRLLQLRTPKHWLFWGVTSLAVFSGLGIFSAVTLFRLPSIPNCRAIFWPTASASLRIYCAQLSAERRTVDDLLKAISLVNSLPDEHPLRPEIDRNIEDWAKEILDLAEESFQQGDLSKAIATAKRIPRNTEAQQLVEQQIQDWQTVWDKAEGIYQEAEDLLRQQNLREAFLVATRLLDVGNRYWETTKYKELNYLITATREDSNKLGKAKDLASQGGLSNLLAAIKLVEEIKPSSPLHAKAQQTIADFGRDMLELAEATLDQRDYDGAIDIASQIPNKAGLQAEVRDFKLLAEAQAQAWGGTTDDIESAIVRAQKIGRDRPLYGRAQQLISYWQLEIQDVRRLSTARQFAQGGAVTDLRAAIAEAELIPSSNPRGAEARDAISQWTATIETIEDRPYLNRAEQLASSGDIRSLQAAIAEANRIGRGRALYAEAGDRIADWQNQIERIQDQPILQQARLMANSGNLADAINIAEQIASGRALYEDAQAEIQTWTAQIQRIQDQPLLDLARRYASQGDLIQAINIAQQIASGRVLYDEAQTDIQSWQAQTQGRDQLQQAYNVATAGTPDMLINAIQLANEVPEDNPARVEANQMMHRWSWQVLQIAEAQATYNPQGAIAIARSIPTYTEAYNTAQQEIQTWQQQAVPVLQQP